MARERHCLDSSSQREVAGPADDHKLRRSLTTNSQVVAGVLRVSLCSVVLGGAKCNGRHAEIVNKIKA